MRHRLTSKTVSPPLRKGGSTKWVLLAAKEIADNPDLRNRPHSVPSLAKRGRVREGANGCVISRISYTLLVSGRGTVEPQARVDCIVEQVDHEVDDDEEQRDQA
jgi:hypothetical protein